MMMKIKYDFWIAGLDIQILRDDRQGPDEEGNYEFSFENENGIIRQEQGIAKGESGAVTQQGGWS